MLIKIKRYFRGDSKSKYDIRKKLANFLPKGYYLEKIFSNKHSSLNFSFYVEDDRIEHPRL